MLLLAGCVTQRKYDALETRYQELNRTMSAEIAADQAHITLTKRREGHGQQ